MTTLATGTEALDGEALRRVFASASAFLTERAKDVDAINVYPVPDGDTGSNMASTLREAIARAAGLNAPASVPEVLSTIARGALYGARGNSGVILSQALRGFAAGVGDSPALDGGALGIGLEQAAAQAYRAVSNPQEGTMLTVLREAGAAAQEAAQGLGPTVRGTGCALVLAAALRAAEKAEAATMDQLPALREAGVPDAGGEGICVILRGLLAAITGDVIEAPFRIAERPLTLAQGHANNELGFCTEFLLEAPTRTLDVAVIRALAESGGNTSVVVVGDEELVRVHAHSAAPEALLEAAGKYGSLSRVKVEDMSAQNERYRAAGSGAGAKAALLAMSRGQGFDEIFESLGAAVSDLGVVEKPPAGQIAEAADRLRIADVIVLANHKNVLLAAEQARTLARCTLHVVPTVSLPQGIAAAMAFDSADPAVDTAKAMLQAAQSVKTIEVTVAAASRTSDGVAVSEGEPIVLVDGKLVASAPTPEAALSLGISRSGVGHRSLVTIYAGEDISEEQLAQTVEGVLSEFPGVEVEGVFGGQPLYAYIASVE